MRSFYSSNWKFTRMNIILFMLSKSRKITMYVYNVFLTKNLRGDRSLLSARRNLGNELPEIVNNISSRWHTKSINEWRSCDTRYIFVKQRPLGL